MDFLSNTQFIRATANDAILLFAVIIVLQILLAAGILPVSMAWGGRRSELTPSLRISCIIAAILLGTFIFVIRYRAGLVNNGPIPVWIMVASWIITAFMALNTLGNLASLSTRERIIASEGIISMEKGDQKPNKNQDRKEIEPTLHFRTCSTILTIAVIAASG